MNRARMTTIAAVALLAALLSGCAGTPASGSQPQAAPAQASDKPAAGQPAASQSVASQQPAVSAGPAADLSRYERPGFVVKMEGGRLWVFRAGSKELAEFEQKGEPARQVVRPAAGPGGITLKAVDPETLDAYMAAHQAL